MTLWAVVPAKDFRKAKSRLGSVLAPDERARVARSMLEHVLETARRCTAISETLVVTNSDEVARVARHFGAHTAADPSGDPALDAIVTAGLHAARAGGADRALVLMSDLPRLDPDDLHAVIGPLSECDWVLVPDRHERNTNALGLHLDGPLTTAFGMPRSLAAHCQLAGNAQLRVRTLQVPSVQFDLDTPEDHALLSGARE